MAPAASRTLAIELPYRKAVISKTTEFGKPQIAVRSGDNPVRTRLRRRNDVVVRNSLGAGKAGTVQQRQDTDDQNRFQYVSGEPSI